MNWILACGLGVTFGEIDIFCFLEIMRGSSCREVLGGCMNFFGEMVFGMEFGKSLGKKRRDWKSEKRKGFWKFLAEFFGWELSDLVLCELLLLPLFFG